MAAVAIGALRVDLSLGTAEFEEGAKKAKDKAKKSADGIKGAFARLGKIFTPFRVAVAGAIAALGGLALEIRNNIDHFDNMAKKSRQIGLSVEEFSGLQLAAEQSAVSMDELARGFRNLARNVVANSQQFKDAVAAIGIDIEQFAGLDQQERLFLLADKFSELRESGNKTAIAMKILGEEMGPRFINLLNNGRKGLKAYIEEAKGLGIVVSTDAAVASEKLNDNIDRMMRNFSAFGRTIAQKVVPYLLAYSEILLKIINYDFTGKISEMASAVRDKLVGAFEVAGQALKRFSLYVLEGQDAVDAYNASLARTQALRDALARQVVNRAAKGDLESTPPATEEDTRKDAPSLLAQQEKRVAAKQAEAQAVRDLTIAETTLAQLRAEFAGPEEERSARLDQLRQKLSKLKDGTIEAAEAHRLYAMAAKRADADVTSAYAGMASSVLGSLGQIFTKSKGFAIAQAVIDTYSAFNRALANPPGPPFSYAQAAAALVSGFAKVRAITSTNPGSSGAGGAAGSAAAGSGGDQVQAAPRQAVNLTLHGQRFSRDDVIDLMGQMNDLVADGAVLNVGAA